MRPAPPSPAWTDPAAIARWWWHRIPGTTIAADARVGGIEGDAVDTVTVRFADDGDGTLVTVVHETGGADAADYESGWRETLEQLQVGA